MPKGVVPDDSFNWGDDRPPDIPWSDTVIYEAHVRGLTKLRDDIPQHERGTFAGLARPAVIDYLRRLGITAIELLPVHAFVQDRHLVLKGLRQYWGYNTLAFFAPEPLYLCDGSANEMRVAIRRLHAAGIEVILDVVYNHTAECRSSRADAVVPRPRQCQLLPAGELRPAALRERHRHRQYVEPVASAGAADGDGQPALLGRIVPHRRLPLRPHGHARAGGTWFRSRRGLLRRAAPGPHARPREVDRRALGYRPRRLSGRPASRRLCRMERQVPRQRAPLLARRRGTAAGDRRAPRRLG